MLRHPYSLNFFLLHAFDFSATHNRNCFPAEANVLWTPYMVLGRRWAGSRTQLPRCSRLCSSFLMMKMRAEGADKKAMALPETGETLLLRHNFHSTPLFSPLRLSTLGCYVEANRYKSTRLRRTNGGFLLGPRSRLVAALARFSIKPHRLLDILLCHPAVDIGLSL